MAVGSCVPSDLYTYIFHFLSSNGLKKSAKAFKKETGGEYTPPADLGLVEILNEYLSKKTENILNKSEEELPVPLEIVKKEKLKKKRKLEEKNVEDDENQVAKKKKKKNKKDKSSKEQEVNEEIQQLVEVEEAPKPDKKKKKAKDNENKTDENGETENNSIGIEEENYDLNNSSMGYNNNGNQAKNVPFRRVKEEEIIVPAALQDNRFEAKRGSRGDWGEKANRDLIHTQGKSFRHEKTKKKRGSYRGGLINTSVNSIKFDDSD